MLFHDKGLPVTVLAILAEDIANAGTRVVGGPDQSRLPDATTTFVDAQVVLVFLIAHQVSYFQSHIYCRKLPLLYYRENFHKMQNLPESAVRKILSEDDLIARQKEGGNIFELARELGIY